MSENKVDINELTESLKIVKYILLVVIATTFIVAAVCYYLAIVTYNPIRDKIRAFLNPGAMDFNSIETAFTYAGLALLHVAICIALSLVLNTVHKAIHSIRKFTECGSFSHRPDQGGDSCATPERHDATR